MKSFVLLCSALFLISCSTTTNKHHSAGNLDVNLRSNLEAELDVDMSKKVQGKAFHSKLFGLIDLKGSSHYADGVNYGATGSTGLFSFMGGGVVDDAKSAAAFNALHPAKADIIIAPQYIVKVESWFFGAYKEVTAHVTGYAGKIRNIKQSTKATAMPVATNN